MSIGVLFFTQGVDIIKVDSD